MTLYQKCIIYFVGIIALTTVGIEALDFQYIIFSLFLLLFLLLLSANSKFFFLTVVGKPVLINILPSIVLMVWGYGVFLGFLNGNPPEAIVRNFAGMVFYLFYYALVISQIDWRTLVRVMLKFFPAYFVICLAYTLFHYHSQDLVTFDTVGITAFRFYYSPGVMIAFLPIGIYLFEYFNKNSYRPYNEGSPQKKITVRAPLFIIASVLVISTGSKGFYAAYGLILASSLLYSLCSVFLNLTISRRALLSAVAVILGLVIFNEEILHFFTSINEMERSEDQPRVTQRLELLSDLNFFGHGLGASLSTGYSRDDLGYGFELSYLNIIHKFGVVSIPVFLMFIMPIVFGGFNILKGKRVLPSVCAISMMLYLIPSYGNPTVFAPIAVLFNCVAYYIIFNPFSSQKAEPDGLPAHADSESICASESLLELRVKG